MLLGGALLLAQEGFSPLTHNTALMKKSVMTQFSKKSSSYNDIYIYEPDTISLPFLDDFSTDKFTPVSEPGDANVSEEIFYRIEIGGSPDFSGKRYVDDTTYTINITQDGDDLLRDSIPNSATEVTVYDLSVYPFTSETLDVWTDTTYIDSLWTAASPDFKLAYQPDYVQDSVNVYTVSPLPNASDYVWEDRRAWRNFTRGKNPPTVGIATLDAIDEDGFAYNLGNVSAQGLADELTSKAILMEAFTPADSLYLSFFYQYQGNGDAPEPENYLQLEFWSPLEEKWNIVWDTSTGESDEFTQVMVPIKDINYFVDGFQFRFQNYGTLSGAVDHWHIDYIYLNNNRSKDDKFQPDLAFRYNLSSLLDEYTSIPWEHYKATADNVMSSEVETKFFNNNDVTESFQDHMLEVLYEGTSQTTIAGPSIVADFLAQSEFTHTYNPKAAGYEFDRGVDDYSANFDVKAYFTHASDFNSDNDTINITQKFYNYYSYDDGSPEGGYYVLGDNISIAQRFNTLIQDTLRAVQINFQPVAFDAQGEPFYLSVWKDDNGMPGELIFQNIALSRPEYVGFENDGFVEYKFESPIILPQGSFFVGFLQTTQARINIGFDINNDNSDKIFYNVGEDWFRTGLKGTLMMRTVFKSPLDQFILSSETPVSYVDASTSSFDVSVYPNPFGETLFFNNSEQLNYVLFDVSGKILEQGLVKQELDVSHLSKGMYMLRLSNNKGQHLIKKLIKQ